MGAYTKAIVAALMAGLTAVITALSQDPSLGKWVVVAIAVVNAIAVFVAPNLPKGLLHDIAAALAALRLTHSAGSSPVATPPTAGTPTPVSQNPLTNIIEGVLPK